MIDAFAGTATAGEARRVGCLDDEASPDGVPLPTDFRRLVRLVQDNERLLADLESIRTKIRRAWVYLSEPGCNAALALTHLERLRMKRSALLSHLRANRVEARSLLGRPLPGDEQIELN